MNNMNNNINFLISNTCEEGGHTSEILFGIY